MKILLEFLDCDKKGLHEQDMEYDGPVPIPAPGETVYLEPGQWWKVLKREFLYYSEDQSKAWELHIRFWCQDVKPEDLGPPRNFLR